MHLLAAVVAFKLQSNFPTLPIHSRQFSWLLADFVLKEHPLCGGWGKGFISKGSSSISSLLSFPWLRAHHFAFRFPKLIADTNPLFPQTSEDTYKTLKFIFWIPFHLAWDKIGYLFPFSAGGRNLKILQWYLQSISVMPLLITEGHWPMGQNQGPSCLACCTCIFCNLVLQCGNHYFAGLRLNFIIIIFCFCFLGKGHGFCIYQIFFKFLIFDFP